jgi:hypothetical protein
MAFKYIFYIVVALLVYRAFFQPKVVIERHYGESARKKKPANPKKSEPDYAEFEELE